MTINSHIKRNSKNALHGQWSKGIAAGMVLMCVNLLLYLLENIIFDLLTSDGYKQMLGQINFVGTWITNGNYENIIHIITLGLIVILMLLLVAPLLFGMMKWSFAIASAHASPIALVFYYYTGAKKYLNTIKISMAIFLRTLGYSVLSVLPAAFVYSIAVFYHGSTIYNQYVFMVIVGFSALALILGVLRGIYAVLKYILVAYIYVEKPDFTTTELISASSAIMKDRRPSAVKLILSMLPLALLCVFVVPIIFIIPYCNVVFAIYAKYMITRGEKDGLIDS